MTHDNMDTSQDYIDKSATVAHEARAGDLYSQLIRDQVQAESARKTSLEQRGSLVATTSAGLTTIIFALAAFTHRIFSQLPELARLSLIPSITLFVLASGAGVACSWPQPYQQIMAKQLELLTDAPFWDAPLRVAERRVYHALAENLIVAQTRNRIKARILIISMSAQVCAIGLLAVSICAVLLSR